MKMKTRFRSDADNWSTDGSKITSPEKLNIISEVIEKTGPVLVKHWFYRLACAPEYKVFDDYEEFEKYLYQEANAGDAIDIWSIGDITNQENLLVEGKCPDEQGLVPKGGAY